MTAQYYSAPPETLQRVMAVLTGRAGNGSVTTSVRQVADYAGCSRETARRALGALVRTGHLTVERKGTGNGYGTRYAIAEDR